MDERENASWTASPDCLLFPATVPVFDPGSQLVFLASSFPRQCAETAGGDRNLVSSCTAVVRVRMHCIVRVTVITLLGRQKVHLENFAARSLFSDDRLSFAFSKRRRYRSARSSERAGLSDSLRGVGHASNGNRKRGCKHDSLYAMRSLSLLLPCNHHTLTAYLKQRGSRHGGGARSDSPTR